MRTVDLEIKRGFFHVFAVRDAFMAGSDEGADKRRLIVVDDDGGVIFAFYDFDKIKEALDEAEPRGTDEAHGADSE